MKRWKISEKFHLAFVESKRKARASGKDVPGDDYSPFNSVVSMINSSLIHERRLNDTNHQLSGTEAYLFNRLENRILELLGRDQGMIVLERVDEILDSTENAVDYTQADRSIQDILVNDFGVELKGSLLEKGPQTAHDVPRIKKYLSGFHNKLFETSP